MPDPQMNSRLPVAIATTFIVICLSGCAMAQQACGGDPSSTTDFGRFFNYGTSIQDNEPAENPTEPGLKYTHMRYRLAPDPAPNVEWELVLRRGYTVVDTVSSHSFDGRQHPYIWTGRIPLQQGGVELKYDLKTGQVPADWTLRLDAMVAMPSGIAHPFYSRQDPGRSAIKRLEEYDNRDWWRHGNPVGMLVSGDGQQSRCCSGTMVTHDLFLTNRHCVADGMTPALACKNAIVDLSWDGDAVSRDLQCEGIIEPLTGPGVPAVDAVLLRLRPLRDGTRIFPATFSRKPAQVAENGAYLIHHPACARKSLTPQCSIKTVDSATGLVTHTCDTETGSSGAPVFNAGGQIVALHREGFQLNAAGDCDKLNKAIAADSLLRAFPNSITQRFKYAD
jgi:hypothetical protein